MPCTHILASKLSRQIDICRESGEVKFFIPDAKTQVTMKYTDENGTLTPINVHTIVISVQHDEGIPLEENQCALMVKVIKPIIPKEYLI